MIARAALFALCLASFILPARTSAVRDGEASTGTVASGGLDIWYELRGAGEITLLFVHCWSCDHTFWREQLAAFARNHRVVTLDLGGHGKSRGHREAWRIRDLGRDVVAVADALGLERIILVGHSMGGPVSLEAARLMPGRVLGVIAADTLHDATVDYADEEVAALVAAFEADFAGTMTAFFSGMAGAGMDEATKTFILAKAASADPTVAIALLADFDRLDLAALFEAADTPIRAINAAPGGTIPPTNFEANRRFADFDAVLVENVGHFLQLEAPEAFNAHLERAVAALAGAAASSGFED